VKNSSQLPNERHWSLRSFHKALWTTYRLVEMKSMCSRTHRRSARENLSLLFNACDSDINWRRTLYCNVLRARFPYNSEEELWREPSIIGDAFFQNPQEIVDWVSQELDSVWHLGWRCKAIE